MCCHIDLCSFPHQSTLFSYQEASGVALETGSLMVLLCFFGDGQAKLIHVQKVDCSVRGLRKDGTREYQQRRPEEGCEGLTKQSGR